MQKKILMDNCIESLGLIVNPSQQEQQVQWGNLNLSVPINGYRRKKKYPENQAWKQEQIECLPTIARLSKGGAIQLCTYNEIRAESWKRHDYPALPVGDLFQEVDFLHIPSAIERSYLSPLSPDQLMGRRSLIEFCKMVLNSESEAFFLNPEIKRRFPEGEAKGIKDIGIFRSICKTLDQKHYPDAFHLWTAEVNDMDYFLTTDNKFINALSSNKELSLKTKPIIPSNLLADLGCAERDPLPFKSDRFYTYFEEPD